MPTAEDAKTLGEIVDEITHAGVDERTVRVQEILEAVGQRSFGPLLLVPGLIILSPISGIPGASTLGGLTVLLIAGQMLIGRDHFWVPQFILRRKISRRRMSKAGKFLMPVARFVDRLVKPRLSFLTQQPFNYLIAATCCVIAAMMPLLEAIPFTSSIASAGITAFGLSLVAYDGVLVLLAFALTTATFYFLITALLL